MNINKDCIKNKKNFHHEDSRNDRKTVCDTSMAKSNFLYAKRFIERTVYRCTSLKQTCYLHAYSLGNHH